MERIKGRPRAVAVGVTLKAVCNAIKRNEEGASDNVVMEIDSPLHLFLPFPLFAFFSV